MKDYCINCNDIHELKFIKKLEKYPIKKDVVEIEATLLECSNCGESFENGQLENSNYILAADQYRGKNNLLTTSDIIKLREKYNISQRLLGRLLRWSESLICQYENGKIQDISHDELLTFIDSPWNMYQIYSKNKSVLQEKEAKRIIEILKPLIKEEEEQDSKSSIEDYYCEYDKNFNGNRSLNFNKLIDLINQIVSVTGEVTKTKLFKILFYIDFLNYKSCNESVSGIVYEKLPFGPVPENYPQLINSLSKSKDLKVETFIDIHGIEITNINSVCVPSTSLFTPQETEMIYKVSRLFKNFTAKRLSELSHEEDGYIDTNDRCPIDYSFAKKIKLDL